MKPEQRCGRDTALSRSRRGVPTIPKFLSTWPQRAAYSSQWDKGLGELMKGGEVRRVGEGNNDKLRFPAENRANDGKPHGGKQEAGGGQLNAAQ